MAELTPYPKSGINAVLQVIAADVVTEPVTVDEFKANYAKIDFSEEDVLIGELITSARETLEKYTNLSFVSRGINAIIRNECGGQELPMGPIVGDIVYTNSDGDVITDVTVDGDAFASVMAPRSAYIKAIYAGGYDTGKLPKSLKMAVMAQTLYQYEHRGDEMTLTLRQISPDAEQLCKRFRRLFTEFFL